MLKESVTSFQTGSQNESLTREYVWRRHVRTLFDPSLRQDQSDGSFFELRVMSGCSVIFTEIAKGSVICIIWLIYQIYLPLRQEWLRYWYATQQIPLFQIILKGDIDVKTFTSRKMAVSAVWYGNGKYLYGMGYTLGMNHLHSTTLDDE